MGALKTLFHGLVMCFNMYTIYYDQKYVELPCPNEKIVQLPLKGRVVFLTFWCFLIQTLYFTLAFLSDVVETSPKIKDPVLRRIKDSIFPVAFTLAIYVVSMFWIIYAIDKEMIFPEYIAEVMPGWINHSMHTAIAVFILIELFTSFRKSSKFGMRLMTVLILSYLFFILYIASRYDFWVYPFLQAFNWPLRIGFFAVNTSMVLGVCCVCDKINSLVWRGRMKGKSKTN